MLKKKPVKKTDKISVTFETRDYEDAGRISLVGEFNAWHPERNPMKKRKDGAWAVTMRLPGEGRFEYRFVVDGQQWVTDAEADGFATNPFGGRNSLVILG
jgi:1,4-alpha-glucan branching enzyme